MTITPAHRFVDKDDANTECAECGIPAALHQSTKTPAHTSRALQADWGTTIPVDFSDPLLDELAGTDTTDIVADVIDLRDSLPDVPDPAEVQALTIDAMTELAHHLGDSGFLLDGRWHDVRPDHGPNPLGWLTFINGVLALHGHVLLCWCDDDATLGSWYALGAREWHARWDRR